MPGSQTFIEAGLLDAMRAEAMARGGQAALMSLDDDEFVDV